MVKNEKIYKRAFELYKKTSNKTEIAKTIKKELSLGETVESLRRKISKRIQLSEEEKNIAKMTKVVKAKSGKRVLVIGDLHQPFTLEGYLDHCLAMQEKYQTDTTVFIGDVIDNHFSSYHETDPDGMGGGQELQLAIDRVKVWYEAFPKATVIIGNHDRLIMRKAFSSAIPKIWIKEYSDVLQTPGWEWTDRVVIDDVQYVHGEAGTARTKMKADLMSTVQGHLHTQAYTEWNVGANFRIFGMQVGSGIDHNAYAMAYAKRGKKPAVGVGIVLDGNVAINELMAL